MDEENQARHGAETEVTEVAEVTTSPDVETATPAPAPIAERLGEAIQRMSYLTLSLVQQREELTGQERQAAVLAADIVQRKARIESDQEELWAARGAVTVLQQLQQKEG